MGLWFAVLATTMMLGAMMSFDSSPDEQPDPKDPDTPEGPTVGDDVLTVTADATGQFDALAGDDTISVNAETGESFSTSTPLDLTLGTDGGFTDDGKASLQITGGAGNDVLDLSGSGYAVTGGEGADLINLGDEY